MLLYSSVLALCATAARAFVVPSTAPSSAAAVDPALLSVSIEFFAFPGYTQLAATDNCLANIAALRGAQPAVRIGGTTQYVFGRGTRSVVVTDGTL